MLILIVLFFLPLIALTIYIPYLINDLTAPLNLIYTLSYLRCVGFQVAIIGHYYILEQQSIGLLGHIQHDDANPPESLGGSWDLKTQLSYIQLDLTGYISFKKGDEYMDKARDAIYGNNMPYISFFSINNREIIHCAVQVGMMDVFSQLSSLLEMQTITADVLNTSRIQYIMRKKDDSIKTIMYVLFGLLSFGYPLILIIGTVINIKQIRQNKITSYKCLTALPKNVVSTVAEYLRVLQKDKDHSTTCKSTDDIDLNKQEENILKILVTQGDTSSDLALIICTIFLICLFIGCGAILIFMVIEESTSLIQESPHVDYLLGAYTYDAATVLATDLAVGEFYNYSTSFTIPVLIIRFKARLERSQLYYARLLYGEPSSNINHLRHLHLV